MKQTMKLTSFTKFAWGVLAYNLLVILWGAYVRATGSGAGCGSHWPLCNGEVLPRAPQIETLIEFAHRLSSGVALVLVVGLFFWSRRVFSSNNPARQAALFSLVFIITEALVGAGLVLFEWVAHDASVGRAISMAVHLINTFLLLAALSLTAWWSSHPEARLVNVERFVWLGILLSGMGVLILGVSGALNALGDTLFPVSSLAEGIAQDFSPTAHFLIRLRLLHPGLAVTVSMVMLLVIVNSQRRCGNPTSKRLLRLLSVLVILQLVAGVVNVLLLAPVWMQIVHLLLADAVWIAFVLFSAAIHEAMPLEVALDESAASQK